MCPYCLGESATDVSRMPIPQITSAVQPAMPKIVIKARFLYRNKLRAATLFKKPMRRQIKPMRSRKMREPARGALGRMSEAGVSAIS